MPGFFYVLMTEERPFQGAPFLLSNALKERVASALIAKLASRPVATDEAELIP